MYALLKERPRLKKYDVVYMGIAQGKEGVRSRLRSHRNSKRKGELWSHFCFYEVWPNITIAEVDELEGLFRHIYRKDTRANRLNRQRGFGRLKNIRIKELRKWPQGSDLR